MKEVRLNKQGIYELLEGMPRNKPGMQLFDSLMITLILLNILAVILGTVDSIAHKYNTWFLLFEGFSVAVFSIELVLRYWVTRFPPASASEVSFWASPFNWVDIISILPFYLSLFINIDLRMFRLLRLIRILRITRYFRSMTILISVISQETKPMLSALVMIMVLMLFSASGIYWLEKDIQPETFGNLPSALWWVIVTLSTVGYGDVVPVTPMGKLLGSVVMILGIAMVALPAGMLASRFTDTMHRQQEEFRNIVQKNLLATGEGQLDQDIIEHYRQELLIGKNEAQLIINNCLLEQKKMNCFCPHCGEKIHT
ncbi:MAG: ion transporter [Thiolinea sp.]